jgi:hypothetical protein
MGTDTYLDAEIIRLMTENEETRVFNEAYETFDINTGVVVIDGKRVGFERKILLDNKLNMMVPQEFRSIPPEELFQSEDMPDVLIINDDDGTIQLSMKQISQRVVNDEEVAVFKSDVKQFLSRLNPKIVWLGDGRKEIKGKQIVFFEFITPILDASIYNFFFYLELNCQVLSGSFTTTEHASKAWKNIFHQMLQSIEVIASEERIIQEPPHKDFTWYRFDEGYFGMYQGHEYRFFRTGETECLLVSEKELDCMNGFEPKDGVFKKVVNKDELTNAYELKLQVVYGGCTFQIEQKQKSQIKITTKVCDQSIVKQLQLEMTEFREYGKWINKTEIEDVIENKLPIEGF